MKTSKIFSIILLSVLFTLCLCACGEKGSKVKDYQGYYTYTKDNYSTAIEITKDGAVTYRVRKLYDLATTVGTINVVENKGYFYSTDFDGDKTLDWTKCFPLALTLINDGEGLYVESDADTWTPDSYIRVDKETYYKFCSDKELIDAQ